MSKNKRRDELARQMVRDQGMDMGEVARMLHTTVSDVCLAAYGGGQKAATKSEREQLAGQMHIDDVMEVT